MPIVDVKQMDKAYKASQKKETEIPKPTRGVPDKVKEREKMTNKRLRQNPLIKEPQRKVTMEQNLRIQDLRERIRQRKESQLSNSEKTTISGIARDLSYSCLAAPVKNERKDEFKTNLQNNEVIKNYVEHNMVNQLLDQVCLWGDGIRFGINYGYELTKIYTNLTPMPLPKKKEEEKAKVEIVEDDEEEE